MFNYYAKNPMAVRISNVQRDRLKSAIDIHVNLYKNGLVDK